MSLWLGTCCPVWCRCVDMSVDSTSLSALQPHSYKPIRLAVLEQIYLCMSVQETKMRLAMPGQTSQLCWCSQSHRKPRSALSINRVMEGVGSSSWKCVPFCASLFEDTDEYKPKHLCFSTSLSFIYFCRISVWILNGTGHLVMLMLLKHYACFGS